jgi:hypothetical protein
MKKKEKVIWYYFGYLGEAFRLAFAFLFFHERYGQGAGRYEMG